MLCTVTLIKRPDGSWLGVIQDRDGTRRGEAISADYKCDTFERAVDFIRGTSPAYAGAQFIHGK